MRVLSAEEMRDMDRRAFEEYGITGVQLMEMAGRAVALVADHILQGRLTGELPAHPSPVLTWLDDLSRGRASLPARSGLRVCAVCGTGNNGGDGFVAARHLANWGYDCTIFVAGDPGRLQGEARLNYEALVRRGLPVIDVPEVSELRALEQADLIIDALLGTGIRGEVMERISEVMDIINSAEAPVLSVDIPSGINADTGEVCGNAVVADVTVTFAAPKTGLLLYPGADFAGAITVADIGIPAPLMDLRAPAGKHIIDGAMVSELIPERESDSHKGDHGHALLVAGSPGLTGAAEMAGRACVLSGAGLTTVACPGGAHATLAAKFTEVMTLPLGQPTEVALAPGHAKALLEQAGRWTAVGLGPGIGRDPQTISFVRDIVPKLDRPFVLDADALFALGEDAAKLLAGKADLGVITPHPGELARLLGTDAEWVQSNRLEAAGRAADDFGVVCVLKGAHTIVAEPQGRAFFNLTGNAGLAKGGSGDVLTGIILALLTQGLAPVEAAVAGVWLHGRAADIAAARSNQISLTATDCLKAIPEAFCEAGAV
jgi:NAD(P)H-hydrate epimerase